MTWARAGIRHQRGLSYAEVLAAVFILAATLTPLLNSLLGAMDGVAVDRLSSENHYRLVSRLEELLATPHATLSAEALGETTETSYSDAAGITDRRRVFIANYDADDADGDGDSFTGGEAELLWIRVDIEGSADSLEVLRLDQ